MYFDNTITDVPETLQIQNNTIELVQAIEGALSEREPESLKRIIAAFAGRNDWNKIVVFCCQVLGISVERQAPNLEAVPHRTARQGRVRFGELDVLFREKVLRLRMQAQDSTPATIDSHGRIHLRGVDTGVQVRRLDPLRADRNSGVYFPQLEGQIGMRAVRFNPKNLGQCPGGCVYCQRAYQLPTPREQGLRQHRDAEELVDLLLTDYPELDIKEIGHVLVVTELYGSGDRYLDDCQAIRERLDQRGFLGKFSALAQEVRSLEQIGRLQYTTDRYEYCYTLEHFERREELMTRAKARPLDEVFETLHVARGVGFDRLAVNYILGLDSLEGIERGISRLERIGVQYVGLNLFYPYSDVQLSLVHPDARSLSYYLDAIRKFCEHGFRALRPQLYERFPAIAGGFGNIDY